MCEELSGKCNHRKNKNHHLQLIIQSASSVEVVLITAHWSCLYRVGRIEIYGNYDIDGQAIEFTDEPKCIVCNKKSRD